MQLHACSRDFLSCLTASSYLCLLRHDHHLDINVILCSCRSVGLHENTVYQELWDESPVATCGSSVVKAYENSECYVNACSVTIGNEPGVSDLSLFDYPGIDSAIHMLLWMLFFRLTVFEFNESGESKLHALRRHFWTALVWRLSQLFITASILLVGYTMELVIAGHAPEGLICPVTLAFSFALFISSVNVSKACHEPPITIIHDVDLKPHWAWWVQLLLQFVIAALFLLGPVFFEAPIVTTSDHHRRLGGSGNTTYDDTDSSAVINGNLLIYFTCMLFLAVALDYIYRREYEKIICCGRHCCDSGEEENDYAGIERVSSDSFEANDGDVQRKHVTDSSSLSSPSTELGEIELTTQSTN